MPREVAAGWARVDDDELWARWTAVSPGESGHGNDPHMVGGKSAWKSPWKSLFMEESYGKSYGKSGNPHGNH